MSSGGAALWDFSLDSLRQNFDVDDLLTEDWDAVVEAVVVNGEPVIATIAHPLLSLGITGDHAVVIVGIEENTLGDETVHYMDPMTGNIEQMPVDEFQRWWDNPGQRAFTLQF